MEKFKAIYRISGIFSIVALKKSGKMLYYNDLFYEAISKVLKNPKAHLL